MMTLRAGHSMLAFLVGSAICLVHAAPAAAQSIGARPGSFGLHESDCLVPGVIAWYSGNAISNGMGYNPCRNPIPLPSAATPASPPATVGTVAPDPEEALPSPEPSSPVAVAEPPQRNPASVPTYAPWTATAAPGANGVGDGNGSSGYSNPYNRLAPSARAVVRKSDFCNRNGRSQDVSSACIKSVDGR
jgi:hypothetical protein